MYIDIVPNRNSRPAVLLREAHREGKRIVKRTIANLTSWPAEKIEALRCLLKGETMVAAKDAVRITRSRAHGHVVAVLGALMKLGLHRILDRSAHRNRQIVIAMIVARILDPRSKLATARSLAPETAHSTLLEELGLESVDEDDLYAAMDWLLTQQTRIENAFARRHLKDGTLILYDVSSSYFEGRTCSLARFGHSRDKRPDRLQIVYGLLCDPEGRPIAVEVFEGNTGDPATVGQQVDKIRKRFGLKKVVFVGDRGMITTARIREDLRPGELDWITALRAPDIQKLCAEKSIAMSLFDERDLVELSSHPDYPGERLIVCRNPALAMERTRKREDLLATVEKELEKITQATARARRPLRGKDQIGIRVGKAFRKIRMQKHFDLEIGEDSFRYTRKQDRIDREAITDGLYVIRTSVESTQMTSEDTVRTYKDLAKVERAFRTFKRIDLKVRPIYHRSADRVRAHVFLCMLAYYVEWQMRQDTAPLTFQDDDRESAEALRNSPVAPAARSERADAKAATKMTADGEPVHNFRSLISNLATIAKNRIEMGGIAFERITRPTPFQEKVYSLLGVATPS